MARRRRPRARGDGRRPTAAHVRALQPRHDATRVPARGGRRRRGGVDVGAVAAMVAKRRSRHSQTTPVRAHPPGVVVKPAVDHGGPEAVGRHEEGAQGAELDSMQTQGLVFAAPLETGLDAMLHKYGVRLNKHIVEDLQCSKIPIQTTASGSGGRFQLYGWIYNPILKSKNNHLINKNLDPVKVEFSSTFDTTSVSGINFTTLYQTSGNNRYKKLPSRISFRETANEKIIPENFKAGATPVALLLEGSFGSYFKNRIAPAFTTNKKINFKESFLSILFEIPISEF